MIGHFKEVRLSMNLENIVKLGRSTFLEIFIRPPAWLLCFFITQIFLLCVIVEKEYMKLGIGKIVSQARFDIVVWTQALLLRLLYSFLTWIFLQWMVLVKKYMKQKRHMIVDKVIENLIRGWWIPVDSVKSEIILKILVIRIRICVILSWINPIRPIRLVHVI